MKVAIITYAFYESTLPLFKNLSDLCEVDLYCLFSDRFLNPPGFNLLQFKMNSRGSTLIDNNSLPNEIIDYLGPEKSKNMYVFISKNDVCNTFIPSKRIAKIINDKEYDVLHFINYSSTYLPIIKFNTQSSIIFSLHESNLARANKEMFSLKFLYKSHQRKKAVECLKHANFITFFSNNEKEKYVKSNYYKCSNLDVIKFGLFESLNVIGGNLQSNELVLHQNYYLYVGYVRPYKGVELLVDVFQNNKEFKDSFLIIAGKDEINISSKIRGSNIILLNKFLSDEEFTSIIKGAYTIVLPYLEASQSGIPSVAFCFNKPVIYSNINGLNEYIKDDYNGLSFKVNDGVGLKDAMIKMRDSQIYDRLVNNIVKSPFEPSISWEDNAQKFIKIYNTIKK